MYRVLACLTGQHDYRLVVLAAIICAATTTVSFDIFRLAQDERRLRRLGWLLLTGVCIGAGIWSTHFVAMLAYDPGLPTAYDPVLTIVSLLIGTVVAGLGFAIAARGEMASGLSGGALVGIGIGLMHYTGIRALVLPGSVGWDPALVAASWIIGGGFSTAAMWAFQRHPTGRARWIAPGLLTLAICSLHFTSMGAIILTPDPTVSIQASIIERSSMAMAIAGGALLVLSGGVIAATIESQNNRALKDVLARLMKREEELQVQNERFNLALASMSHGLCMFDKDQRLVMCNERYAQMFDLTNDQVRPGTTAQEIIERCISNGIYAGASPEDYLLTQPAAAGEGSQWRRLQQLGNGRTVSVVYSPMQRGGFLITYDDITEQSQAEARIAYMAHHDALTDLPNRTLLLERLACGLARVRRGEILAVHCLDLDRFKEVNEEFGHPIGDAMLKAVGERLRRCIRVTDTIARFGGDEFAVAQIPAPTPADASAMAARFIEELSQPFEFGGRQIHIGASVGIAMAPSDGLDAHQLLRNADMALYDAKKERSGTYRFFEPEMNARMQFRRDLERDLRQALVNGEFELFYQPLLNLQRDEVSGFEALVRWRHPQRGLVSPATFIPLAEETGLIEPLGEWVIRQACAQVQAWPPTISVAVNVSPVQFTSKNLLATVIGALAASGLTPQRLEIEVTESVLLQQSDGAEAILRQLHGLGIKIALDDFGTGYSSLSYLRCFPFDKIKIDRSFINDLGNANGDALAILRAVTQLGKTLGMVITAEGVETKEQLEIVRAEGCTEVQGYLLSPPKPAAEAIAIVRQVRDTEAAA